ncbi:MAG: hypothetical protein KZQ61_02190, partial [Candidatus Thiodiazotropha sp. (ex Lucinoma aequizonata)]|nr:hypothetical protein [Candidatus Thiodiazotropha sp. (ex Lucinoma aequizonata)]
MMEKTTNDQVAVAMVDEIKQRYSTLRAISMDKGFHNLANQQALKERLECGNYSAHSAMADQIRPHAS